MAEKTRSKSGRSRPQAQSKNQGRAAPQAHNADSGRGGGKATANGTGAGKSRDQDRTMKKGQSRGGQGRQAGREQTAGGAANVADTLKQHPITTAAMGAGLTLLAAQGLRMAINASNRAADEGSDDQRDEGGEEDDARGASASDEGEQDGGEQDDFDDEGEGGTSGFAARFRQGASSLGRIGSKVGQAFRGSGDAIKRGAQSGYDRGRQRAGERWTNHPLVMCGVALAAGAAVGFLIPGTRQEDRLMGKQSDKLTGRFKVGTREAFRQGRTIAGKVVNEAVNTASKEAEREGLAPDRLGKKFKRVFSNVRDAVAEAVQDD